MDWTARTTGAEAAPVEWAQIVSNALPDAVEQSSYPDQRSSGGPRKGGRR
ncbi:hypothetical protein GGR40_003810 [Novosphingobium gossypii]